MKKRHLYKEPVPEALGRPRDNHRSETAHGTPTTTATKAQAFHNQAARPATFVRCRTLRALWDTDCERRRRDDARTESQVGSTACRACVDTNPHAAPEPLTSGFRTHMGVQLGCRRAVVRERRLACAAVVGDRDDRSTDVTQLRRVGGPRIPKITGVCAPRPRRANARRETKGTSVCRAVKKIASVVGRPKNVEDRLTFRGASIRYRSTEPTRRATREPHPALLPRRRDPKDSSSPQQSRRLHCAKHRHNAGSCRIARLDPQQ